MSKCPRCGVELENNAEKCNVCGLVLNSEKLIEEVSMDGADIISLDDMNNNELVENTKEHEVINNQSPQQSNFENETTVNNSFETVSVNVNGSMLEEEKVEEKIIEMPEIPEPTIGEINPELLGNIYDENERINNAKIEAKKQQELIELERKRKEQEELKKSQTNRPDLLAGRIEVEVNLSTSRKKTKFWKIMLVLLILLLIGVAVYYYFVIGIN